MSDNLPAPHVGATDLDYLIRQVRDEMRDAYEARNWPEYQSLMFEHRALMLRKGE